MCREDQQIVNERVVLVRKWLVKNSSVKKEDAWIGSAWLSNRLWPVTICLVPSELDGAAIGSYPGVYSVLKHEGRRIATLAAFRKAGRDHSLSIEIKKISSPGLGYPRPHDIVCDVCYAAGRQKTEFANGEKNFGAYMELVREDGSWISQGNNIVPVLPDGRLLMVVEQRPPQGKFSDCPKNIELENGQIVDFSAFGPYSSLEFPGGAVDSGEILNQVSFESFRKKPISGNNRQLCTWGVLLYTLSEQTCLWKCSLGYLPVKCELWHLCKSDGGLHVLALTPEEIEQNIGAEISVPHRRCFWMATLSRSWEARQDSALLEKCRITWQSKKFKSKSVEYPHFLEELWN